MIQAERDLVDLEQVIKGTEKVGRNNRGDDLGSVIKEDRGGKGGILETVGQDYSNPPDPPAPPRRSQRKFEQEDL